MEGVVDEACYESGGCACVASVCIQHTNCVWGRKGLARQDKDKEEGGLSNDRSGLLVRV